MKAKEVIVLDADTTHRQNLVAYLKANAYTATPMNTLANMDQYVEEPDCRAVVLNLDSIPVTNKMLRDFKHKKPSISIIAHSKRQFHPELEEALREYILVCLADPVDTKELSYWLKSLYENNKALNS